MLLKKMLSYLVPISPICPISCVLARGCDEGLAVLTPRPAVAA
jgi:hypothetical protein